MNNILAIIVLYNPEMIKLERLYQSLFKQVSSIILVDNSPTDNVRKENEYWLGQQNDKNNYYLSMNDNLGIATAQNKGIEFAKTLNADFVLLLDQDSVLPENMVNDLMGHYDKLSDIYQVACIAPTFFDRKTSQILPVTQYQGIFRKKLLPNLHDSNLEVAHVIASGMLVPVDAFDKIGWKLQNLFIDYVDVEWCLRANRLGYRIFVCPKVVMEHNIGDDMLQVGDRSIMLHSDFRNYFAIRNAVYLILYHKLPMSFKLWEIVKLPMCLVVYTYASKNRFNSIKTMMIAIKDGILKKMGKGYFENKGL